MKILPPLAALLFLTTNQAVSEDRFLEGFPDVPLLDGIEEIAEERVVFDTPGGTVAQTAFVIKSPIDQLLAGYSNALTAFGWTCSRAPLVMNCVREGSKLLFKGEEDASLGKRIILRLQPSE